jgi:hypothetical protein
LGFIAVSLLPGSVDRQDADGIIGVHARKDRLARRHRAHLPPHRGHRTLAAVGRDGADGAAAPQTLNRLAAVGQQPKQGCRAFAFGLEQGPIGYGEPRLIAAMLELAVIECILAPSGYFLLRCRSVLLRYVWLAATTALLALRVIPPSTSTGEAVGMRPDVDGAAGDRR